MAGKKNKNQPKKKKSPGQPPRSPNLIAWEVASGEYHPGVRADAGSCRKPLAPLLTPRANVRAVSARHGVL